MFNKLFILLKKQDSDQSQSKLIDTDTDIKTPATLLTKQQLKDVAAKKPRKNRYSTDEEKPVAYSLPDETDTETEKKKK